MTNFKKIIWISEAKNNNNYQIKEFYSYFPVWTIQLFKLLCDYAGISSRK